MADDLYPWPDEAKALVAALVAAIVETTRNEITKTAEDKLRLYPHGVNLIEFKINGSLGRVQLGEFYVKISGPDSSKQLNTMEVERG